jgi:hypothetical protein
MSQKTKEIKAINLFASPLVNFIAKKKEESIRYDYDDYRKEGTHAIAFYRGVPKIPTQH